MAGAAGSAARRQSRPSAQSARVPQQSRGGSADAGDPAVALVAAEDGKDVRAVPGARRPAGKKQRRTGDAANGSAGGAAEADGKTKRGGRSRQVSGRSGSAKAGQDEAASDVLGRGDHRDNGRKKVTADADVAAEAGLDTESGLDAEAELDEVTELEGDPDMGEVGLIDAELEDLEDLEDLDEGADTEDDLADAADTATTDT